MTVNMAVIALVPFNSSGHGYDGACDGQCGVFGRGGVGGHDWW